MFADSKWGSRIAKPLLYTVYVFLTLEIASRLLFSIDPIFRRVRGADESSARIAWVKQHYGRQNELIEHVEMYDPTRGWALKPGIKNMPVFDGKILNSNSKGLRGKTDYAYARQKNKGRILVLGDSFTFGEEVSDDETYPHYLEGLLPDTEVLNFGVSGYGHDQMLLYLRDEGVKYKPDIVLLGFVSIDISRNALRFFNYAKPQFELHDHQLVLTNVPVTPPAAILKQEPYRSKALDVGIMLREKIKWSVGINDKEMWRVTDMILDQIVAATRQMGAVPVFVYLPVGNEILAPQGDTLTFPQGYFLDFCRERGIACLFLRQRFQEEIRGGAQFKIWGHWNAKAHMVAAQAIRDYLLEEGLTR